MSLTEKSLFTSMTAKIIYFIAVVCAICASVYFGGMHLSQVYIDDVVMGE